MTATRRNFLRQAALASAAPALLRADDRPNVLWLMTDEQRPDSLGCYGRPWASTPHTDELAAEGVLYESAYTPAPVCVPARSAMLSGRYGSTLDVLHNQQRLSPSETFLTWPFEDAGYQSASFGKKHYFIAGRQAFQTEAGRPTEKIVEPQEYARRYDMADHDVLRYPDVPTEGLRRRWILSGQFPEPQSKTAEAENIDLALRWLNRRDAARPFFLRLSLNAPHTPVVTPRKYLDAINPDLIDLPIPRAADLAGKPRHEAEHLQDFEGALCLTPDQIRQHRHYYYARAAFADAEFGRLLSWMRPRGLLDNTIVVYNSDHGTHLGDHGLVQKQTFYEQIGTVPYFFWWKGLARRGVRLQTPVNTISMMPTLLELAGLDVPPACEARGLADPTRFRDTPDGSLYNLATDPGETANLFTNPQHRQTVKRLTSRIIQWDRSRKDRA